MNKWYTHNANNRIENIPTLIPYEDIDGLVA